jgi:hypothetical protein
VSGSWWAGAVLGLFYLFGLVSPLLLSAAGIGKLRGRLHDPKVSFTLAGRRIRSSLSRLIGGLAFIVLGVWLIVVALSGNARNAPGFQKAFGRWLSQAASDLNSLIPAGVGWALMLATAMLVTYLGVRALRHPGAIPAGSEHARCEPSDTTTTKTDETQRGDH